MECLARLLPFSQGQRGPRLDEGLVQWSRKSHAFFPLWYILNYFLVNVTPAPIFSWLKGLDNGMLRRVKMLRGMFIL